jgi:VWFA-related protein
MQRSAGVRAFAVFTAVVTTGSLLLSQQAPNQPAPPTPAPTFRSSIEAVQVSAIVTDADGRPVTGLTKDDFEIIENGAPQPITTFSAVDIPTETAARTAEADVIGNDGPTGRLYLIALDDMSADQALRTRHFLREFIERHFGSHDLAAVVLTTQGLRTSGQEFTSNRRLLLEAIDKFDGGSVGGGWHRVKNALGSLRDLTEMLAELPAQRKAMIFMSSHLGNREVCGCDAERLVGYRPGVLGGIFQDIDANFIRAVSAATRGNVAIYPINPAGLTTDLPGAGVRVDVTEGEWQLRALAEITGGFAVSRTNNFADAFERIVRENSTYYLLGFNSSNERRDGRYIRLEVRVKHPDLQVRALDGYLAPRGDPERDRQPGTLLAAVRNAVVSPVATAGVPMQMFAAPFRGPDRDAVVMIGLEIAASRLGLVEQDGAYRGQIDIVFAVTDARNTRRPLIRHRAELALQPETFDRVGRSALRVISQLSLPEGRYQIRASAGGAILAGSVVYDLQIPDFRDDFALSGVTITSSRALEALTVSPHVRIDVDLPGPPTTAREFWPDETLTLFVEAYENRRRAHTAQLTVELRDASGRTIAQHPIQRESDASPTGMTRHVFAPNVSLEELPAGAYTLRVEARSSLDARKMLAREIPFTVR